MIEDPWKKEGLPPPGTVLLDRYKLTRVIARGGMGVVYVAFDQRMNRTVAVKVLPERLHTKRSHARFIQEARLSAAIDHPNVIKIFDAGLLEGGVPFLSMELLKGQTVYQQLRASGAFGERESLKVISAVLTAATVIHEHGTIHRDIKPSNVFICSDSTLVKVIDFGLSKDLNRGGPRLTGPREALGTPSYMSPEQVLADDVDARTDVYGAGTVFYEMLTGKRAFPASSEGVQTTFAHILKNDPPPPRSVIPELSEEVEAIALKALAKEKEARFQSPYEMRKVCDRLLKSMG